VLYRAYAKVNLTLEVVRKREDGFHELASLAHTINLGDDLSIERAVDLRSSVRGMQIDPTENLVTRAARLFAEATSQRRGAEILLRKRIPVAAGLGGGSSDAATALVALNKLWGTHLRRNRLAQLAARLGSDVPFFIRGGAALIRGRGEALDPLPSVRDQWLVLLVPSHSLADKTKHLYASLHASDFSSGQATLRAANAVRSGAPISGAPLVNGFERAARAIFPALESRWQEAERVAHRPFHLSGAGPALFALARDRSDAYETAGSLGSLDEWVRPVRTVGRARASLARQFIEYP
jgi:4-diphosphocytidyl-2-C-methyl-D-erythritol kinase